jgi:rubrerythrin
MEQLTVEEIIKYAIRVEQESFQFYRRASRILAGSELKGLVDELSEQEVCQISELKAYIKDDTEVDEKLSRLLTVDTTLFDRIIATDDIPPRATPVDILQIALERETLSRKNYEMLQELAKITDDIRSSFRSLREMAERHVEMIRGRINRAKDAGGSGTANGGNDAAKSVDKRPLP